LNILKDFSIVFRDKDWLKKTLIGGLFLMIPILNIFSFGFLAMFIHNRLETGNKELPLWNNWVLLFVKGMEWGIVIVIYFTIPVLVLSLLPGSVMVFLVNPQFVISSLNPSGFFVLLLSVILGFAVMFFLPMALILSSEAKSFIEAIQFQKIFERIRSKLLPYIVAYVLMVILLVLDFILHIILNMDVLHFGSIPSYFIFAWLGFIVLLISASIFVESF
jgi:hypothetical protein